MQMLRKILRTAKRRVLGTITHVWTQDPIVALTFDDGPDPHCTPRLLQILGRHQAHATFFMLGEAAQKYPDIVERVAQGGHAIGNHTWDHPSLPLLSGSERRRQLRACEQAIAPYGQGLFRPPFGHQNVKSRLDALCLGFQVVTWNIVAMDWLDHDAQWMANRVINEIQPGSVILFHDSLCPVLQMRYADREPTLEAVYLILERLHNCFRFVTIPELLRHGQPQFEDWYRWGNTEYMSQLREPEGKPWRYASRLR
jgi:peptidoglycan-N-acetylglucosamine deacetylase